MSEHRFDDEQNRDSALSIASILGEYWAEAEAADAAKTARSSPSGYSWSPRQEADEDGVRIYHPRNEQPVQPEIGGRYASLWADSWVSRPVRVDTPSPVWEPPVITPPPPPAPGMSVREILSDYWESQAPQGYGVDLDEPEEKFGIRNSEFGVEDGEESVGAGASPSGTTQAEHRPWSPDGPEADDTQTDDIPAPEEEDYSISRILAEYWASQPPAEGDTPMAEEPAPEIEPVEEPALEEGYDLSHVLFGQEERGIVTDEEPGDQPVGAAPEETGPLTVDTIRPQTDEKNAQEPEEEPAPEIEPLPVSSDEELQEHLLTAMLALGIDPDAPAQEAAPDEDEDVRVWGAAPAQEREDEDIRVWGLDPVEPPETSEEAEAWPEDEDVRVWGVEPNSEFGIRNSEFRDAETDEQSVGADASDGPETDEEPAGATPADAQDEEAEDVLPPEVEWDAETQAAFDALVRLWDDVEAAHAGESDSQDSASRMEDDEEPADESDNEPAEADIRPQTDQEPSGEPEEEIHYDYRDILTEYWENQRQDEFGIEANESGEEPVGTGVPPEGTSVTSLGGPQADAESNTAEEPVTGPRALWARLRGLFRREQESAGEEPEDGEGFVLEETLFSPETLALDPELFESEPEAETPEAPKAERPGGDTRSFAPETASEEPAFNEQGKAVDMLTNEEAAIRGGEPVPEDEQKEWDALPEEADPWAEPTDEESSADGGDWSLDSLLAEAGIWDGAETPEEPAERPDADWESEEPLSEAELKDRLGQLYAMMSGSDEGEAPLFAGQPAEEPTEDTPVDYFAQALEAEQAERQSKFGIRNSELRDA